MDLIKKIIKESIDVGNVLFGEKKPISKLQNKKYEVNTEPEQLLFDVLSEYIRKPDKRSKNELIQNIGNLNSLKQKFPKLLIPEKNKVYRGTAISKEVIQNLIKKYGYKETKNKQWFILKGKFDYESTSKLSSWTYDFNIANQFAFDNFSQKKKKNMQVIISTIPDSTFIVNYNLTNAITKILAFGLEYETISIKQKFKNCEIFFKTDHFEN